MFGVKFLSVNRRGGDGWTVSVFESLGLGCLSLA